MHAHYCQAGHGFGGWPHFPAWGYVPYPYWYGAWCQVCGHSYDECRCSWHPAYQLPQEMVADSATASAQVMVGGTSEVAPTLEYMPDDGATSPSVTLSITDEDGTVTVEESSIPAGYHVKKVLSPVVPGAIMKLEVTECLARVRWLEQVSY